MWREHRRVRLQAGIVVGMATAAAMVALLPTTAFADDSCPPETPGNIVGCVAGSVVGGAAQGATQDAVRTLTQWVVDAAIWVLSQVGNIVFNTAPPDLGANWFHQHYADMVAVAWVTAPIFLLLGILQALIGPDPGRTFGRIFAQLVFVALLSTGAVAFTTILIGAVDQLSNFVSRNSLGDLHQFLTVVMGGSFSAGMGASPPGAVATATPLFFLFLAGVVTVLAGLLIWLELLARTLVIYAALLFFPILLAAALLPRLSGMVQALAEVIVAVIVSKFIIVVIVAVGVSALAATGGVTGDPPGGTDTGPSLLVGAGLLLIAAWAPWKLYRLMPALEAAMVHQVGHQFQQSWTQARWRAQRMSSGVRRAATTRGASRLPIAGQPAATRAAAPAAAQTAGTAAAGVATAGLATAAAIGSAGLRMAGGRVAGGVQLAGWQGHAVAPAAGTPRSGPASAPGFILRPGPGVTRNPRPPAGP